MTDAALHARPSFLFSYAYHSSELGIRTVLATAKHAQVLVDSGAFTAHRRGEKVDLETYSSYVQRVQDHVAGCVQLDVPGDSVVSEKNYWWQREHGARVSPVLTVDMDLNRCEPYSGSCQYICAAGGLSLPQPVMAQRLIQISKRVHPGTLVHALAYVRIPDIYRVPLYSTDSSSMIAGQRYGIMFFYRAGQAMRSVHYNKAKSLAHADLPEEARTLLMHCGVGADLWRSEQANRGHHSLVSYLSLYAVLMLMREAARNGRVLYCAVASVGSALLPLLSLCRLARWDGKGFNLNDVIAETERLKELRHGDQEAYTRRIGEACGPQGYGRGLLLADCRGLPQLARCT